jgi:hypothetical protein
VDSGFTIAEQQLYSSAIGGSIAWKQQGTAAAVNPTWTLGTHTSSGFDMGVTIASFKANASTVNGNGFLSLMGLGSPN